MNKTLFLLRKSSEQISAAVFLPAETDGDVVLLEEAVSAPLSLKNGKVFTVAMDTKSAVERMTYEDLVERIFQSDRVLVV